MPAPLPLQSTLSSYVPNWIANLPGSNSLFKFLWTVERLSLCLQEIAFEGQMAAYPGVGTPTALPLIGASRDLLQGANEPQADYIARLINWINIGKQRGSGLALARAVQSFLAQPGGTYLVVRVQCRNGDFFQSNADRSTTVGNNPAWDWDNLGGWVNGTGFIPPATIANSWTDIWVLVQDFTTHYTSFTDTNWLAAWGSGTETIDSMISPTIPPGVFGIVKGYKGLVNYSRAVVLVPDPTSFTPNGFYGNNST